MAQRVTVLDVAKAAGVHPSTVSRALKPETRSLLTDKVSARILEVASALGYRPNGIAASLRTRRSQTVGVVIPDITNPVFPPNLRGLEEVLDAEGYIAMVANAGGDAERQRLVVDRLLARQVDGLVMATVARRDPVVDFCIAAGTPLVMVNRAEAARRVSSVVSDDALGMGLAIDHLAALGHRRIGLIAGPQHLSTGLGRRQGFTAAMERNGLAEDPAAVVFAAAFARDAGREAAGRLLDAAPDITAVMAANDLLALGVYDVAAERGLRCPEDLSVIGHNDMPMVDMVSPALTTVHIRHREMGMQAGRLLLSLMRSTSQGGVDVVLQPTLIVRASTATARA